MAELTLYIGPRLEAQVEDIRIICLPQTPYTLAQEGREGSRSKLSAEEALLRPRSKWMFGVHTLREFPRISAHIIYTLTTRKA